MIRRQWIISAIVSILILLIGGALSAKLKSQKKSTVTDAPVAQEILFVQTQNFPIESVQSTINIDGRIQALEKIDVAAEVQGRLMSIGKNWKEGSYFNKGDLLFQVDSEDQKFNLYAQRSSLLNAITQIMPDLKLDYPAAFQKWKNYLDNFQIEQTTPALPKIEGEQEKYFVASKNIYTTFYNIKGLEDRFKNYQVYAPFSGVFLSISAHPGSLVSPGLPIANIMNTNSYELSAPINQKDFGLIRQGQTVELLAKDLGKKYKGRISRISNTIDQTTQSIPVYVNVTGSGLRDGMYLEGSLKGSKISNVASLPNEAIINQNLVYVLQDSFITQKEIEVILRTDSEVHVRGIESNEEVIVKGVNSLSPGQKAVTIK